VKASRLWRLLLPLPPLPPPLSSPLQSSSWLWSATVERTHADKRGSPPPTPQGLPQTPPTPPLLSLPQLTRLTEWVAVNARASWGDASARKGTSKKARQCPNTRAASPSSATTTGHHPALPLVALLLPRLWLLLLWLLLLLLELLLLLLLSS
jgi:hypothetical protein